MFKTFAYRLCVSSNSELPLRRFLLGRRSFSFMPTTKRSWNFLPAASHPARWKYMYKLFGWGNNKGKQRIEGDCRDGFQLAEAIEEKIRLKRKRLIFGSYVLLAAAAYLLIAYEFPKPAYREAGAPLGQAAAPEIDRVLKAQQEQTLRQIRSEGGQRLTYIQRSYVCGEEQQELGLKSAEEITALNGEHPDWIVSLNSGGSVIFTQHIDDLSPKCKQSAYFGVDESGNLSLFDGLPANDKVIRTFSSSISNTSKVPCPKKRSISFTKEYGCRMWRSSTVSCPHSAIMPYRRAKRRCRPITKAVTGQAGIFNKFFKRFRSEGGAFLCEYIFCKIILCTM